MGEEVEEKTHTMFRTIVGCCLSKADFQIQNRPEDYIADNKNNNNNLSNESTCMFVCDLNKYSVMEKVKFKIFNQHHSILISS